MAKKEYWYARGYYDGRTVGVADDLKDLDFNKDAASRLTYKRGYDRGVFDYCEMDVDSEVEEAVATEDRALVEAAPDLLACLLDVLDADGDLNAMDFNRYRATIAKATRGAA